MRSFLNKGHGYYNEGDYNKAIEYYKKGLKRESENQLELLESIGDAYLKLKKYIKAIEYFDQISKEYPRHERVLSSKWKALSKLTEKFSDNEEYERTIRYCRKALRIKKNADLLLRKGNAHFNIGAFSEAIVCYNEALIHQPNNKFEILENIGDAYLKLKEYTKAIEYFDQVIEGSQQNEAAIKSKSQALGQLAKNYFEKQKYEKSIQYYEKALTIRESADLWFDKGEVRFGMQEYNNALTCYKNALNTQPGSSLELSILTKIVKLHIRLENHAKVIKYCDKVLAIAPENKLILDRKYSALVRLAEKYDDENEYEDAIDYYEKALSIKPSADLWLKEGNAYFNIQHYEDAVSCYEKALNEHPENELELLENIGDAFLQLRDYPKAIQYFDKVRAKDPENEGVKLRERRAFTKLARSYFAKEQYQQAILYCKKAIDLEPSAALWLHTGDAHFHLKNYDTAIECYQKALEYQSERRLEILRNIGDAYFQLKKYDQAIEHYDQILDVEPQNEKVLDSKWESLSKLAKYYFDNEKYQDAIDHYGKAIAIKPNAVLWEHKGNVYFDIMQDYSNAIICYKAALEFQSENRLGLLKVIGTALNRSGRYAESIEYFDQILKERPQDEAALQDKQKVLIEIATAYDEDQNYQKAAETYQQATTLKPNKTLWFKQGRTWFQTKDYKRAIECMNQVIPSPSRQEGYDAFAIKVQALRAQGRLLVQAKDYAEAEKYYAELVGAPKDVQSDLIDSIEMADLSLHLQKIDQSIKYYSRVAKYDFKNTELLKNYKKNYQKALLIKANHLYQGNKLADARSYFQKICHDIEPSDIARAGIAKIDADIAYNQGQYEKAKEHYLKVLASILIGGNATLRDISEIIGIRVKDGVDLSEITEMQRKVHLCQYHIRARNCEAGKEFAQALEYYTKITELSPEDIIAPSRLIEVKGDIAYHQEKDMEKALKFYREASHRNEKNMSAKKKEKIICYIIEGKEFSKIRNFRGAASTYNKLLELDKNNADIIEKKIKVLLKEAVKLISKENYDKAKATVLSVISDIRKTFEIGLESNKFEYYKVKSNILLGDIFVLDNNPREALEEYGIALAMRPDDYFIAAKKIYAGFLILSKNQLKIQDKKSVSLAKLLKEMIEAMPEIDNPLFESHEFSKDPELMGTKTFTELPIEQIEALIGEFVDEKNTNLSDSQDQFAEELETIVAAEALSIGSQEPTPPDTELLDSQDELFAEEMELMIMEEEPLPVESKKRYREDSMIEENAVSFVKDGIVPASTLTILEPSPKKPKKKSLPNFTPKIKNFEEVASDILFKTERDPATYLAPYWQTASLSEDKLFTAPQESEEEKQQREQAKERVADEVGLAGEKLVYAKLKSHYAKKYNASIAETKTGFELKGHYGNADRKAGKAVHLQVEWYNVHSKSCKETFNDHDLRITKKIENEAESTRSVEVKTTRAPYPKAAKFTERELDRMKKDQDQYRIFRVYNIEAKNPEIRKFKNPYKAMFDGMDPELSLASLSITI